MKKLFVSILIFIKSTSVFAMVFDMNKASFGTYLRATVANWGAGQTPFSESSGANTTWSGGYTYIPSYELGFLFNTSRLTWRFGAEIMQPSSTTVTGTASGASTAYYSDTNSLSLLIPKGALEINIKSWQNRRLWIMGEAGSATVTVTNAYNFTTAGSTQFNLSNFTEKVQSTTLEYGGALGFENVLSDNTTIALEVGYRYLDATTFQHQQAATTFQGAVSAGTNATTNAGGARDIDMNQWYAGVDLRIWLL